MHEGEKCFLKLSPLSLYDIYDSMCGRYELMHEIYDSMREIYESMHEIYDSVMRPPTTITSDGVGPAEQHTRPILHEGEKCVLKHSPLVF